MSRNTNILAVDIGNSKISAAFIDVQTMKVVEKYSSATAEAEGFIKSLLNKGPGETVEKCVVCSVSDRSGEPVAAYMRENKIDITNIDSAFIPHTLNHYGKPAELGADRVANYIYTQKYYKGKDVIVIDAGTAVTIDFISFGGAFYGGYILPGVFIKLEALNQKTEKIGHSSLSGEIAGSIPSGTEEAVGQGILIESVAGINEVISSRASGGAVILACGGGWSLYERYVKFKYRYIEDLTLIGTALALEL